MICHKISKSVYFSNVKYRQISEETVASWEFLLMKDALPCVSTCNHTTDKMHFVPKCNAFLFIRKKYLDPRFWEGPILFKFMFTLILVLYKLNFVYFYLRFVNRIALLEYFNFFFRIFRIYTVPLTLYQQMWTYWCTLMVRVKKIEGSNFIILYDHSYRIA